MRSSAGSACSSAAPPPATMPSAIAARVACSASSTRWRTSLASAFVGAPTWITAATDDRGVVAGHADLGGAPEVLGGDLLQRERRALAVHLAPAERGHVLQ